jgi:hypothetical protein
LCSRTATASETLRQTRQECAARTELRRKDPEPLAGSDLVDLVKQVDDVEAQFHAFKDPGVDWLNDTEIDLLVARQARTVWDRAVGPEPATLD